MGRWAIALVLGLACAGAQAQKMYRCGKVYQDRPCPAGQAGKVLGSTGTASASGTGVDAECAQKARDSRKIVWAREGGASLERVLEDARTPAEQAFARDVYRRPGARRAAGIRHRSGGGTPAGGRAAGCGGRGAQATALRPVQPGHGPPASARAGRRLRAHHGPVERVAPATARGDERGGLLGEIGV